MTERRKPAERRLEIADAVLSIVGEKGLGHLTALEIAQRVGVTDAALFHHFRSMEEIILAAIERVEGLLFEKDPAASNDPLVRLGEFFHRRVCAMQEHPGAARLILSDILPQVATPSGMRKVREFRRRSVRVIRDCLREAARKGSLASELDVPGATVLVFGSLMALTQARDLVAVNGSIESLAAKVWSDLERYLRGVPSTVRVAKPGAVATNPTNRSRRNAP